MPSMTDPHVALLLFQQALDARIISVERCVTDPNLYVHMDQPTPGVIRYTYTRFPSKNVSAGISMLVMGERYEGLPCFDIGYAVPEKLRGTGNATDLAKASIKELRSGLNKAGVKIPIYIEAMINQKNAASIRVAEKVFGSHIEATIDEHSGTPAYRYLLKVDP